jgi:hypothetical protein
VFYIMIVEAIFEDRQTVRAGRVPGDHLATPHLRVRKPKQRRLK